jgi:hypothetical protein
MIGHSQQIDDHPENDIDLKGIGKYHMEKSYRFSGYSGFNWFLYRSENLPSRWLPKPEIKIQGD